MDLRAGDLDLIFGKDGDLITTGVAKQMIRRWLDARAAAEQFQRDGTFDIPRGGSDTDEAATSSAAPEGLAKELRRAMYGLISERVTSGAPGDWMAFETAVNEAFDAILARLAKSTPSVP